MPGERQGAGSMDYCLKKENEEDQRNIKTISSTEFDVFVSYWGGGDS